MASKRPKHVVPYKSGWVVRSEGQPVSRSATVYDTRRAAVVHGRSAAKAAGTDLVIHGRDGRIQDVDSYREAPDISKLLLPQ